jgi:hypothetical protein
MVRGEGGARVDETYGVTHRELEEMPGPWLGSVGSQSRERRALSGELGHG